jgi:hypothetical protein
MLFGEKSCFAIECEITNTSKSYYFGRFRIWLAVRPFGDFSGEIISTNVFALEDILNEPKTGPVNCSSRLPDMEKLHCRVEADGDGHRFDAVTDRIDGGNFVPSDHHFTVHMSDGELAKTVASFIDWVVGHPGFLE